MSRNGERYQTIHEFNLSGPFFAERRRGKNVSCIHIHVKHIEVSCLMVEVNNYYLKLSSQLPQGRVRYNNNALQISQVRKEDSDVYTCTAKNFLGKAEKNTLLVVVSLPQFTSKPPSKIVSMLNSTVRLNCSAIGDPQPIISWRKQGGQLSVGRSQQINGTLVITNLQQSDAGSYICTAASASVFIRETVTSLQIMTQKGGTMILENYNVSSYDDNQNFKIMSCTC